MRCSPRSTTSHARGAWRARRRGAAGGAGLALAAWLVPVLTAAPEGIESAAERAIEEAVRHRIGASAVVRVSALLVRMLPGADGARLVATPEPGARLGRPMKFTLRWIGARGFGEAGCVVRVELPHHRTRRAIARGHVIGDEDVERVTGEVGEVPLRGLPAEVRGARTTRDLPAGTVLSAALIAIPPLVRSGDSVVAVVRLPGMEARGRAVAAQNGELGEVIRIVNADSGRPLRARVTARGEVEVMHGS
jgi:flagella basal body P-ring formation protein FlgA